MLQAFKIKQKAEAIMKNFEKKNRLFSLIHTLLRDFLNSIVYQGQLHKF